jgi:hypothetical protein
MVADLLSSGDQRHAAEFPIFLARPERLLLPVSNDTLPRVVRRVRVNSMCPSEIQLPIHEGTVRPYSPSACSGLLLES